MDNFDKLINRVEKIDPEAAEYLKGDAQKLTSFYRGGLISESFRWNETPQGQEYWKDICEKLYE